ncbi:two-component system, NtrC family, nitrogen regulation sensor histidine kinase NtrY [Bradyrhizobium brasilense]|uniref:Two-component system, NtrC family, nitrogen regulation sensor histidine kinase NtrY n=2 Tax=Bradyrhizobium brasilense TaxID=1419277 RepID=A0A1G6U2T8_9BRAD|nr:two-component system, NtrC family, nitrogen regulation sensor histidine kinase NtrY [Bradyrhizobium brasilense]
MVRGTTIAEHIAAVSLFSIFAVLPAVLVAVIANVTIERGLERLFPVWCAMKNLETINAGTMQNSRVTSLSLQ